MFLILNNKQTFFLISIKLKKSIYTTFFSANFYTPTINKVLHSLFYVIYFVFFFKLHGSNDYIHSYFN